MARPLSNEKRDALIAAAIEAVAASGLAASTLKIAKAAGVAEGTLFRYFPTKDDLLVGVYIALKVDLTAYLSLELPMDTDTEAQFRHLWNRFIDWGIANPDRHKALRQLEVALTSQPASSVGQAAAGRLEDIVHRGVDTGALRVQPIMFMWDLIQAVADVTLVGVTRSPGDVDRCKELGWKAMWGAVAS